MSINRIEETDFGIQVQTNVQGEERIRIDRMYGSLQRKSINRLLMGVRNYPGRCIDNNAVYSCSQADTLND
jgi:hypothetical protein